MELLFSLFLVVSIIAILVLLVRTGLWLGRTTKEQNSETTKSEDH